MTTGTHVDALDFDSFYDVNFGPTVGMIYGLTGDFGEAQDIVQEAFSRAWQRWSALRGYDNPEFWIRRVATNLARSRFRRLKVAAAYLVRQRADDVPALSPEMVDIARALKELPVNQRQAVVMHYFVDMSVEDIAFELEVPANTVKSWLHRARSTLSVRLADNFSDGRLPASHLRRKADRQKALRRAAAVATAFIAIIAAVLLIQPGFRRDPVPPATPTPSPSLTGVAFPRSCQPSRLPLPDGNDQGRILDTEPTGRFAVGTTFESRRTVLWDNGQPRVPEGLQDVAIWDLAVNQQGVVAGAGPANYGFVADERGLHRLKSEPNLSVHVNAISDKGAVVGNVGGRPVVWESADAGYRLLTTGSGATEGTAIGFTRAGEIVGVVNWAYPSGIDNRLVLWRTDGSFKELTILGGGREGLRMRDPWLVSSAGSRIVNVETGEKLAAHWPDAINRFGWHVDYLLSLRAPSGQELSLNAGLTGELAGTGKVTSISDDGGLLYGNVRLTTGLEVPVRWMCE